MVQLIKQSRRRPITAAIGDGGNDVSMIQEAHVGIGITGKEGRQATMSADFAFSKFMYLRRTFLVHGHWYYLRISILTQYFFYKNLLLVIPQILFGIHSGFSSQVSFTIYRIFHSLFITVDDISCAFLRSIQVLFDSVFLMSYNVFFTSIPILIYGLSEQDYQAEQLIQYPQLYKLYKRNYLLSYTQFIVWMFSGTRLLYFLY